MSTDVNGARELVEIPRQQGPDGPVGDNLVGSNGAVPEMPDTVEFRLPTEASTSAAGNGHVSLEKLGFAARMAARGQERVSRSWAATAGRWVANATHFSVGLGSATCNVAKHAPSVVAATVKSAPDFVGLAVGPVDRAVARVQQGNADHWTANSIANVGHRHARHTERSRAASQLSGGVLRGVVSFLASRHGKKVLADSERYFGSLGDSQRYVGGRVDSSAEWAATAEAARREMAERKSRIGARYRAATS